MRKIDIGEYAKYADYAKDCAANRVYPLSIADGVQSGDIYTDDNGSVLFWHYCGFAYISGAAGTDFLEEIYREFLMPDKDRRFLLITDSETVADYYSARDLLQLDRRVEYIHTGILRKTQIPDKQFIIERITADNIGDIQGRIIPAFSWESSTDFITHGFGFLVRRNDCFAAAAFSSAVSKDEVDIGIETCEAFRHKGLASYLSYKMCEEIIRQGKKPVWAHAETNEGSRKTALLAGFIPARVNTVVRKKI